MKKFIRITTYIYLSILIILALMPFWPHQLWWIANILQLGPLLLLSIPLVILLIPSLVLNLWKPIILQILSIFIIVFGIMQFQINIFPSDSWTSLKNDETIRILSMNTGKDWEIGLPFNITKFLKFIKKTNPDIIALQESGDSRLLKTIQKAFPNKTWYGSFNGEFSLISTLPIDEQKIKWIGRRAISKYQLKSKNYLINYYNVHFMTPRYGIKHLREKEFSGIKDMKEITKVQETEAEKASKIIRSSANTIISGDFNLTPMHPIYQVNWSKYQNTFSKKGIGFGRSKDFPFHGIKGVRIDHILCNNDWEVLNAKVGPSMDCDHHPVIADLKFIGQKNTKTKDSIEKIKTGKKILFQDIKLIDFSTAYRFEQFEETPGRFNAYGTGILNIDDQNTYLRGNSLRITKRSNAKNLKAGLTFDLWNFEKYPTLSFSYRIPEKTPVCLKVKTQFNDWICLGGTKKIQCDSTKSDNFVQLIDDNQWHEIDINIEKGVRSILPALKYLQEFQFTIDNPVNDNNLFWIDDWRISEDTHYNQN